MKLTLTLIPDDPDEPTWDLSTRNATEEEAHMFPWTEWTITIGQYTSAGRRLREATKCTITDAAGWQAVLSDEDGSVVTGGEIDDVEHVRTKYRITLVETTSSAPDFLN